MHAVVQVHTPAALPLRTQRSARVGKLFLGAGGQERQQQGGAAMKHALLLTLALAAAISPALAQDCPPPRAPQVELVLDDPPITRDFSQPFAALHRRAGTRPPDPRRGQLHLGVTIVALAFGSEMGFAMSTGLAGVCLRPQAIRLTLRHTLHHVMIASEVPPGGCLFQEVLTHEMRHVAVNQQTLATYAPRVREAALRWAAGAVARGGDAQVLATSLRDQLGAAVKPVLDQLNATRRRQQAAIDTPEEYRRLAASCFADHVRIRSQLLGQTP